MNVSYFTNDANDSCQNTCYNTLDRTQNSQRNKDTPWCCTERRHSCMTLFARCKCWHHIDRTSYHRIRASCSHTRHFRYTATTYNSILINAHMCDGRHALYCVSRGTLFLCGLSCSVSCSFASAVLSMTIYNHLYCSGAFFASLKRTCILPYIAIGAMWTKMWILAYS